jgi:hypothetical protein
VDGQAVDQLSFKNVLQIIRGPVGRSVSAPVPFRDCSRVLYVFRLEATFHVRYNRTFHVRCSAPSRGHHGLSVQACFLPSRVDMKLLLQHDIAHDSRYVRRQREAVWRQDGDDAARAAA